MKLDVNFMMEAQNKYAKQRPKGLCRVGKLWANAEGARWVPDGAKEL